MIVPSLPGPSEPRSSDHQASATPLPDEGELSPQSLHAASADLLDLLRSTERDPEQGTDEDDLVAPSEAGTLLDEGDRAGALLDDDGLSTLDEDDLGLSTNADQLVRAGVEEYVVLLDLADVVVLATLATGVTGSVLSAPLTQLSDGQVCMRLGPDTVTADPRGLATRVRLGDSVIAVTLRLVEGAAPMLVLGRDVLAGHVVVDPAARHLLDPRRSGATIQDPAGTEHAPKKGKA
ncbi:MAG: hypothetical protein GXP62_01475 [Oligoflexia bacterium]|nr:hypothetical protein [Oligoflexia bacterium]